MRARFAWLTVSALAAAVAAPATAAQPVVTLTLKDHRFSPSSVEVPAGQKVRIVLVNQDPATEEFDSHDLRVEQVVTPKARIAFSVGPLQPGRYSFMGEFHAATAEGVMTATAGQR